MALKWINPRKIPETEPRSCAELDAVRVKGERFEQLKLEIELAMATGAIMVGSQKRKFCAYAK